MVDIFPAAPAELGIRGEAMVTWFMEHFGCERDPAIGGLVTFLKGEGQFPASLAAAFPELYQAYEAAYKETHGAASTS